jgi:hypothetical protein
MTEMTKMWPSIIPAIIGLFGVLVGAFITTGANYWLAERKEAAEAAKERLSRAIELRTVARLVMDEFLAGRAAAKILTETKTLVPEEAKLPLDAWERDKRIIARELSLEGWNAVRVAALAVEHFRGFRTEFLTVGIVSDQFVERSKLILRDINAGLDALQPYVDDVPAKR